MIDLTMYAGIASQLYTDKLDIYRHTTSLNADGTTRTGLPETPLYEGVACRISFSRTIDLTTDKAINKLPIHIIPKVFCNTDVDIQAGDYLVITRKNAQYKGLAGKPNVYETHQEISITVGGDA